MQASCTSIKTFQKLLFSHTQILQLPISVTFIGTFFCKTSATIHGSLNFPYHPSFSSSFSPPVLCFYDWGFFHKKIGLENTVLFHFALKLLSDMVASFLKRECLGAQEQSVCQRGTSQESNCAVDFPPHLVILPSRISNFQPPFYSSPIFSQGILYCH